MEHSIFLFPFQNCHSPPVPRVMSRYVSNNYYILLMLCDSEVCFVLSVLDNKCSLFVAPHFPGVVTWKVLLFPILFH